MMRVKMMLMATMVVMMVMVMVMLNFITRTGLQVFGEGGGTPPFR